MIDENVRRKILNQKAKANMQRKHNAISTYTIKSSKYFTNNWHDALFYYGFTSWIARSTTICGRIFVG